MTFQINKDAFEEHVNSELEELRQARFLVGSSFALHTEDGCQVQVLITKDKNDFMDAENDYTRDAEASAASETLRTIVFKTREYLRLEHQRPGNKEMKAKELIMILEACDPAADVFVSVDRNIENEANQQWMKARSVCLVELPDDSGDSFEAIGIQ